LVNTYQTKYDSKYSNESFILHFCVFLTNMDTKNLLVPLIFVIYGYLFLVVNPTKDSMLECITPCVFTMIQQGL